MEQIRLAEEVKITKEKIKEVEEEWQSNLLNWKSKRRQSSDKLPKDGSNQTDKDLKDQDSESKGKIKTFSEILKEKSKSGARIGYNLHHYLDGDDDQINFNLDQENEQNQNDNNSTTINNVPSLDIEHNGDESGKCHCQSVLLFLSL